MKYSKYLIYFLFSYHIFYTLNSGKSSYFLTILMYATFLCLLHTAYKFLINKFNSQKSIILNICFSIAVLLMCLLSLEMLLRFVLKRNLNYDEINGSIFSYYSKYLEAVPQSNIQNCAWYFVHTPNLSYNFSRVEYEYSCTTNSLGFRDNEFKINKDSNEYRILTFGDSFTEGIGATADSSYPAQLQHSLKHLPNHKYNVYNCGVSGSDVFYSYVLYKDILYNYHPNMVILTINSSDFMDVYIRGGMERFLPDCKVKYKQMPTFHYAFAFSYLARFFIINIFKKDPYPQSLKITDKVYDMIFDCIEKFKLFCDINNCKFVVVFHPTYKEILEGSQFFEPLIAPLNKMGINAINLRTAYLQDSLITKKNFFKYYWIKDVHHNGKGYKIMSDEIYKAIQPQLY